MKVICQYCKEKGEKSEMVRIDEKNFHKECANYYSDKKELIHTICEIFNLKRPGPVNEKLIKNYFEQGYTYQGMTGALIYHYKILNSDKSKGHERIGIIPYVYDEAKKYFETQRKDKERIIQQVRKNLKENEGKENIAYVKYKKKENNSFRKEISLDTLEKML